MTYSAPSDQPAPPLRSTGPMRPWMAEVVALCVLCVYIFVLYYSPNWIFDDAFMFLRYGHNIAVGHGYTWNAGDPPVDGLTSPLWLGVVMIGMAVAPSAAIESGELLVVLSFIFCLALIVTLYLGCRRRMGVKWTALIFLALWLMTSPPMMVAYHGISGMETTMACVLVVAWLAWMDSAYRDATPTRRRALWLGAFAILLVLTRPELGLLILGSPILLALSSWRAGRRDVVRRLAEQLAVTTALLGAYALVRLHVFGELFPLPFYIKGRGWESPYEDFALAAREMLASWQLRYWMDSWPLHVAAFLALVATRSGRRIFWMWGPLYAIIAYMGTTLPIMGGEHRYFYPPSCGLILAIARTPNRTEDLPDPPRAFASHRLLLFASAFMLIILSISPMIPRSRWLAVKMDQIQAFSRAAAVASYAPEGSSIAATEVGVLGAHALNLRIIDLAGLHDPVFAHGFDVENMFARKPDMIGLVSPDYVGMTRRIRQHPAFADYVCIWPEGETTRLDYGLWVNTNSEAGRIVRDAVMADRRATAPTDGGRGASLQ